MDCYHPSPSARTKGNWSVEEDRRLARLVQEHGEGAWSFIARHFAGRIGKQCRERWHNQLRPDIKRDAWDDAEEQLLINAHQELGNKWSDIAKLIPGRTENAVKNHWNATLRRKDAAGVDGQGRPLTRLKQYMRNVAAGNKRRGNRNSRFNKKEKRNGNVGDDESIEDLEKRQRLQEQEVAAANLGTTAGARPQASFLDFPLAPRSELQIPLNLPINSVQRHSSSHSEADQLLEWLTNTAAVGGAAAAGFAGNGGESNIGGLDDVSALKSPIYGESTFPALPPFTTSGQGGLSLGGKEVFCTPEPPMLASPLISPLKTYSGLGNPTFMHGLGNLSTTEHHALHRCNNIAVFPNPLRPLAFGGERSKSAASSRSAAEILGATATAAANLMNVHVQHLEGNKNTPSTALNRDSFAVSEGAGFFSPPPVTRKVATTDEDQQLGLNNRQALKTRQIAPHAFFSPDSATSPAS